MMWQILGVIQLLSLPASCPFPAHCSMVVPPLFVVPGALAAGTHNPPCEQWLMRLEVGAFIDGPSASTHNPSLKQLVRLDVGAIVGPI